MIFGDMQPPAPVEQALLLISFQRSFSAIPTYQRHKDTWEKSATPKPVFTFDVFDFDTRLYIAEGSSQGRVGLDIIRFLMDLH
jgi:hypothetical protein